MFSPRRRMRVGASGRRSRSTPRRRAGRGRRCGTRGCAGRRASPPAAVVAVRDERWLVGPHDELADLAGRDLAVLVVDHGDVVLGDGATAAARAARLVERVVDRHAGVGRAVGLDQADGRSAASNSARELRDGHPPRQPDRVIGVVGRRRSLVQHRQRGAHEVEDRRTEPPHLGPEARRGEAPADGRRRPEHQRRHHGQDAGVEVEERERASRGRRPSAARSARSSAGPGARRSDGRARTPSTDRSCPT